MLAAFWCGGGASTHLYFMDLRKMKSKLARKEARRAPRPWFQACCTTMSDVSLTTRVWIAMDAGANARGERQAVIEKQLMQQNTQASLPSRCLVSWHMRGHSLQAQSLVEDMEEALLKAREDVSSSQKAKEGSVEGARAAATRGARLQGSYRQRKKCGALNFPRPGLHPQELFEADGRRDAHDTA